MADSEQIVISDTGPLLHLDEVGHLNLLKLFPLVEVPKEVIRELGVLRHNAIQHLPENVHVSNLSCPIPSELLRISSIIDLDQGEIEALALSIVKGRHIVLCDDADARTAAIVLGIPVRGTIGILTLAMYRGLITPTEVENLIIELPNRTTLYTTPKLIAQTLETIKDWRKKSHPSKS